MDCNPANKRPSCAVADGLLTRSTAQVLSPTMASELVPCSCLNASNVAGLNASNVSSNSEVCLALAMPSSAATGLCGVTLEKAALSGFLVPDCETQTPQGLNQHRGEWLAAVRGAWTRATERGKANLKSLDCRVVKPTVPAQPLPDGWRHLEGRNCWEGNGASDLEANSSLSGQHTLSFCIDACQATSECEALIMQRRDDKYMGPCWLRKNVQVASCGRDPHYGLWLRGEPTPDEPAGVPDVSGSSLVAKTLSKVWEYHPGRNCWTGHGALPVSAGDPANGSVSVPQCQSTCEETPECGGIIVSGSFPGKCWLRKKVEVSACQQNSMYTLWLRAPSWEWARRDNTNCYNGRGARWLPGSAARMSIEQCQAACLQQERCRGFVVEREAAGKSGPCFLRADIKLDECEVNDAYVMWFMGVRGTSTTLEATTSSALATSRVTTAATTPATTGSSNSPVNADGFAKLEKGACIDRGLVAISGRAICEVAAAKLGLADTDASTTQVAERPEGCYYSPGHGHRLWMGMNPQSKGRGAETSIPGAPRYPICATLQALQRIAAASIQSSGAKFELRPLGTMQVAPRSLSLGLLGLIGLVSLFVLALSWRRAAAYSPVLPFLSARQVAPRLITHQAVHVEDVAQPNSADDAALLQ